MKSTAVPEPDEGLPKAKSADCVCRAKGMSTKGLCLRLNAACSRAFLARQSGARI